METVIRDVIHGDIVITDPLITRLIDTKEFQRLRNIKQLSTASITVPGAEHTRFSHSIGVLQQFQEIVCFAEFFRFLLALSCLLMYT